jgi:hypothetical protein
MKRLSSFQLLCDCLSISQNEDSIARLRRQLRDGDNDWAAIVQVANQHLLCPTLYGRLEQNRLLSCIPSELCDYLKTLYKGNGERNRRIMAHTRETIRILNGIGIEPVLLKGVANLLTGLYPDRNMRFLSDIDLLVPASRLKKCVDTLQAAGYFPMEETQTDFWKTHHHYPPLLKKESGVRIELHHELVEKKHRPLICAECVLHNSLLVESIDGRFRIPSAQDRIIHNVVHTQLTDRDYSRMMVQLRQLYDFVLLADNLEGKINWEEIARMFARNRHRNALVAYLLEARLFFGFPLPGRIKAGFIPRASLNWFCTQINYPALMRVGSLGRIAGIYFTRIAALFRSRRIPRFWDPERRKRHYLEIASMMKKAW